MVDKFLSDLFSSKNILFFGKSFLWFIVFSIVYYFILSIGTHVLLESLDAIHDLPFGWLLLIVEAIAHLAFGFSIYIMITPVLMLLISFYSAHIFRNIKDSHYQNITTVSSLASHRSLLMVVRFGLFYLLMMLICLPVLLVPIFGHLLYMLIGFLVFRKFLLIDMLGMIYSEDEVNRYAGVFNEQAKFVLPTSILYLISLIPIVGFFIPYISIILITHLMLNEQTKLINQEAL